MNVIAEERRLLLSKLLDIFKSLIKGFNFIIVGIIFLKYTIVNKDELAILKIALEQILELLLVILNELVLRGFLSFCSLLLSPLVLVKLCEAEEYVLEEFLTEHLREQLNCCLQLFIKPWVLRIEYNHERVNIADCLQLRDHIGDMIGVLAF